MPEVFVLLSQAALVASVALAAVVYGYLIWSALHRREPHDPVSRA